MFNSFTEYLRLRQLSRPAMTTPGTNLQFRTERIELSLPNGKEQLTSQETFFVNDALLLNRPLVGLQIIPYAKTADSIPAGQFADLTAFRDVIIDYIRGYKFSLEMDGKDVFDRENIMAGVLGVEFDPKALPIAVSTISMTIETFNNGTGLQLVKGTNTEPTMSIVTDWWGGFDVVVYKLENYAGLEKVGLPGCHKG